MKYSVTVKFRQDYVKVLGNAIEVGVRARPIQGKANKELIEKIADHFGVPQSRINIVAGATSKRKIIEIEATTKA